MIVPLTPSSFRGASETSEPGIHAHDGGYGFRACVLRTHPGMTMGMD
jgi:hypothetical protein